MAENSNSSLEKDKHHAEKFIEYYYETFKNKRYDRLAEFYASKATLSYNDDEIQGRSAVVNYWLNLPAAVHYDCEFMVNGLTDNNLSFEVHVTGRVQYQYRKLMKFSQYFIVTPIFKNKWEIVTDRIVTQELRETDL